MNDWNRLHRQAPSIRRDYPPGTRVLLLHMQEELHPIEDNTKGTVLSVDDIGDIECQFDNGRIMRLLPDADSFRKLTPEELQEEQAQSESAEDEEAPAMGMHM